MKNLWKLNKYLIRYRRQILLGIFITILARIFSLVMPEYVEHSIDTVEKYLSNPNGVDDLKTTLLQYILIILGSAIGSGFLTFLTRQTIINVSRYIEFDLKNDLFEHYEKLSLNFYKINRTGDLMNRISEDVGKVRMYVGPAIMYSVQTLTLFACIVPLMLYTSPILTLYTLIPLPLLSIIIYHVSKQIHIKSTDAQQFLSKISTFSQEHFSGIRVIKSYGLEPLLADEISSLADEGRKKNLALTKIRAWFFPLMLLLIGTSNVLVIYMGGKLYIEGAISMGMITKFTIYVIMLTWPVATVGWISSILKQAEASQKRINEFLNTVPDIQNNIETTDHSIEGDISFQRVSFTYENTNIKALDDISFDINKGQIVSFLGKIGCGKTTILDLLTRCYDISKGEICIDNIPIKQYALKDLRGAIGYVPQDNFLFSDTIYNNLLFGNPNATKEDIEKATKMACVHENIMGFDKQYQTVLGERGITLSGGQKQRLCIARALLKKSKILLFDDCLSAVDTKTEKNILSNIKSLSHLKTCIIITHRVSTAQLTDKIFLLKKGQLTYQGSHEELIAQKSEYYQQLFEKDTTDDKEA